MLLGFYANNYRSFKDGFSFSMMPAPKQKGLDYSILKEEIEGKNYKALSSAVIYGANASGKTNIIGAMDTFKNILLRGNIRNSEMNSPNAASASLELIPNSSLDEIKNTEFGIKFIEQGILIEYTVEMALGKFLDSDFSRKIIAEEFKVNNRTVFDRRDGILNLKNLDKLPEMFSVSFETVEKSLIKIAEGNMAEDELFITNGFRIMFSPKLTSFVTDWIKNKFIVIYRADLMELKRMINNPKEDAVYIIEEKLNEIAKKFGVNSSALGYVTDKENNSQVLCSLFKEKNIAIPAEYFESYGTIRFVNIFPIVMQTLMNGATLVVDEFDASIHPKAVASIINAFHDDDINKNKAQLIFNTHNPIFLTSNLFRRDEIKFVERDEMGVSEHYSLSDFKTYGRNGVRKNEDFRTNYMENRYGAINDVDFYGILKELMEGK